MEPGFTITVNGVAHEVAADSDAVRVFLALALNDAKDSDGAVAQLLSIVTVHAHVTDLDHYADGLRGYAGWLADGRPEG